MLENKSIVVNENEYRLSIIKSANETYKVFLSDCHSQFSTERTFYDIKELKKYLRNWIIQSHFINDPEARIFKELESWDGVINI